MISSLLRALSTTPAGDWAVGVSGGADSTALLHLLRRRADLHPHVVHLNHETRGAASDQDEAFVRQLAADMSLPCTSERLSRLRLDRSPKNPSARYRAARLAVFGRVVAAHALQGVLLAHHADDQAETVLLRLLRSAGPNGLAGMRPDTRIHGVRVLRPLLGIPGEALRAHLQAEHLSWREDASNASHRYRRNRVRSILSRNPELRDALLDLGRACAEWRDRLDQNAPRLPESFSASLLATCPDPLARHAARRWLRERGAADNDLSPAVLARLLTMARDAASSPRQHFPGGLLVRRRGGVMFVEVTAPSRGRKP